MISTAKALYAFFSGFGIPAYTVETVPDEAVLPYIVYDVAEPEWRDHRNIFARVYYRNQSSSYAAMSKADEIVRAVGDGIRLECDEGWIILNPVSPLIQQLPREGDISGALINLQLSALHMPGM